jgi:large subunit ribosomal protein L30e
MWRQKMDEIKKNLTTGKLIIGSKRTLKAIRASKIAKVFLASNAPKDIVDDLEYYASLGGFNLEHVDIDCEDMGTLCKKPFMISVVGLIK